MNFTRIDNIGTLEGYAIIKTLEKKVSKNGTEYLDMTLLDKSGEINAKLWNYAPAGHKFEVNTIVKVRGTEGVFNNAPQFKIDRMRNIDETDNINLDEFVPSSDIAGEVMYNILFGIVEKFEDEELRALTSALMEEYREKLLFWPAAFRLHHAMRGGLLYHTLSIVRLAQTVSALYPTVDRDLLFAGAILHDIAKTEEFRLNKMGLVEKYTVEGKLVGHLVMGAMIVDRKGRELGISQDTLTLLEHMLISHHGEPEFGAATRPLFLEAEILSQLDGLDAKIYEFEKATQDIDAGEFSTRQWALDDRNLFNHGRKTIDTTANLT